MTGKGDEPSTTGGLQYPMVDLVTGGTVLPLMFGTTSPLRSGRQSSLLCEVELELKRGASTFPLSMVSSISLSPLWIG